MQEKLTKNKNGGMMLGKFNKISLKKKKLLFHGQGSDAR